MRKALVTRDLPTKVQNKLGTGALPKVEQNQIEKDDTGDFLGDNIGDTEDFAGDNIGDTE